MKDLFYRTWALIIKELQTLLNDPQGRRILILPVLLQLLLFPFAVTLDVKNNTIAVLNQDSGSVSTELMQRFSQAEAFTHFIELHNEAEMRRTIENQNALVVVYFPSNFSRQFKSGRPAPLQVILDGRRSNSGQIVFGYIQEMVQQYTDEQNTAAGRPPLSQLIVRHWFNPNLDYKYFILPSLVAIITTISALVVTALSVAREREHGTFDQLLVSPLTPEMIMIGKAVPAQIVGAVQATIILTAAIFVYRIPFEGSLILLYTGMFFYTLSLVGFGLLISSLCSTQQQAFLGVFCFMMPGTLLSGYTSPIDNMPGWLQALTWLNPLRHYIIIVKSIFLKDASAGFVWLNILPLIAIAALTLTLAIWIFRRRIG